MGIFFFSFFNSHNFLLVIVFICSTVLLFIQKLIIMVGELIFRTARLLLVALLI